MARKKSSRRRTGKRYALKISGRIRRFRTKAAARKAMNHALKRGKKVRAHVVTASKRTTKRRKKTTRRKARRTTRRRAHRKGRRTTRRAKGRRTTKRRRSRARKGRRTTRRRAKGRRTTKRRKARRTTRHGVKRRRAKGWRGRTAYSHPRREVFGFKSPNTGTYWSVTDEGGRYVVREQTAGGTTKRHRKLKSEAKALQVVWKWVGHKEPELKMAANKRRAMRRGRKTTRRAHRMTTRRVKRRVTRRRGRRTTRRR